MSTTTLFLPAGVKIGSVYLAHVGTQDIDQNLEDLFVHPAGDWAPNFNGSKSYAPEISLESMDVTNVLDLMTINALCADLSAVVVDVYQRSVESHGMAYDTDETEHLVFRMTNDSMLYWDQITVNQNDEIKISSKICLSDNGSNEPIVQVPSQAIEDVGAQNAPFTLGPLEVLVDGATTPIEITGVKQITWANNPEVLKEAADGDATPGFLALAKVRPVISFETTDLSVLESNFSSADEKGVGLDRVTVWLRRRRPNHINYADTETVHAKLEADADGATGTVAYLKWTKISNSPAKAAVQIALHRVGTAALFAYTKDVAIVTGVEVTTTTAAPTTTTSA